MDPFEQYARTRAAAQAQPVRPPRVDSHRTDKYLDDMWMSWPFRRPTGRPRPIPVGRNPWDKPMPVGGFKPMVDPGRTPRTPSDLDPNWTILLSPQTQTGSRRPTNPIHGFRELNVNMFDLFNRTPQHYWR